MEKPASKEGLSYRLNLKQPGINPEPKPQKLFIQNQAPTA